MLNTTNASPKNIDLTGIEEYIDFGTTSRAGYEDPILGEIELPQIPGRIFDGVFPDKKDDTFFYVVGFLPGWKKAGHEYVITDQNKYLKLYLKFAQSPYLSSNVLEKIEDPYSTTISGYNRVYPGTKKEKIEIVGAFSIFDMLPAPDHPDSAIRRLSENHPDFVFRKLSNLAIDNSETPERVPRYRRKSFGKKFFYDGTLFASELHGIDADAVGFSTITPEVIFRIRPYLEKHGINYVPMYDGVRSDGNNRHIEFIYFLESKYGLKDKLDEWREYLRHYHPQEEKVLRAPGDSLSRVMTEGTAEGNAAVNSIAELLGEDGRKKYKIEQHNIPKPGDIVSLGELHEQHKKLKNIKSVGSYYLYKNGYPNSVPIVFGQLIIDPEEDADSIGSTFNPKNMEKILASAENETLQLLKQHLRDPGADKRELANTKRAGIVLQEKGEFLFQPYEILEQSEFLFQPYELIGELRPALGRLDTWPKALTIPQPISVHERIEPDQVEKYMRQASR